MAGVFLVLLLVPVAYVELACRGTTGSGTYRPVISDPAFVRREANTYLTYPEWHIVYAYDGMAEALKTGDEHTFDYVSSVRGFWSSTGALMEVADAHGGADFATRSMIHTIGVSFTAEMALKAAYEETLGRLTAALRGRNKAPQDRVIAAMSVDYATFLRQTPWYRYPFTREARKLWSTSAGLSLRGWIVRGLDAAELEQIPDVKVIGNRGEDVEIETPRYDLFTRILVDIARRGGTIMEIAGNDDIMVTVTAREDAGVRPADGRVIFRMIRDGFQGERLLIDLKVAALAALMREMPLGDPGLEHVFDY
jgi:hypothetical protein